MNGVQFTTQERGRLRTLQYEFWDRVVAFKEEYAVTEEEEKFLFSDWFLKYLMQDIEKELLESYKKERHPRKGRTG
jgi:hypothetical protein